MFSELALNLGHDNAVVAVLLETAIKGAVILAFAAGLSVVLRRAPASLRHLVWSLAVAAILIVPVLTPLLPRWRAPLLPEITPASMPAVDAVPAKSESPAPEGYLLDPAPEEKRDLPPTPQVSFVSQAVADDPPEAGPMIQKPVAEIRGPAKLTWSVLALLVWAAGALAVLAGIVLGVVHTWVMERRVTRLTTGPLARMAEELSAQIGLTRRVILLQCSGRCMPMTWGIAWPKILLPSDAIGWPSARLRAVLLHELAHVKRLDFLTQLLARVACALHWFNPLVWMAARRLRIERELACDDEVLRVCSRPSEYAEHLLCVARSSRATPLSVAMVAMARPSQLSGRLRAVLDAGRARTALSPQVVASAWLGTALLVLPVAGAAPRTEEPVTADLTEPTESVERVLPAAELVTEKQEEARQTQPGLDGLDSLSPASETPAAAVHLVKSTESTGRGALEPAALPAQSCDWMGRGGGSSTSIDADDDRLRVKMRRGNCELEVHLDGKINFNESYTGIASLSSGGELEIEEKEGRDSRRLVLEASEDGSLNRTWYVNREERPYDAEARAWLSDMLLVLFRRAGLQATERAEYIFAHKGVDGLLQEISQIPSDYTARRYYTVLLSSADLDPQQVREIVQQVGEDIDSDYELAQLLIAIAENQPLDESVRVAYVEAAKSIDSDYEHRRVLSAILKRENLSPVLQQSMLESATMISSDYELAELLIELIGMRSLDDATTTAFFAAVGTIDSDYEKRRVLNAALKQGASSQRFLDLALATSQDIGSDYELARLLVEVAALYPMDQRIPESYVVAAGTIDSDFELSGILTTLVNRGDLTPAALTSVLEVAQKIDSDHEMGKLLGSIVRQYGVSDATRPVFFRDVDKISSDFERQRVLSAVLSTKPLTEATVEAVLESALEIDSDHETANLLTQLVEEYSITDNLRPAFDKAVGTISSKYERDQVLSAAYRAGG